MTLVQRDTNVNVSLPARALEIFLKVARRGVYIKIYTVLRVYIKIYIVLLCAH